MTATSQSAFPRAHLGGYEVLAPIAEGGMATIYLGRATSAPHDLVALKVIRAEYGRNRDFIAMFLDEATIASRLSHPNIVRILELGHDGRQHFLAMELLRGQTLLAVWYACRERGVRIPYPVVAWIGARIADALHHAHELRDAKGAREDVVHRDVNPSNIFLTDDGVPKIIDFGLARAANRLVSTAAGIVKGKLAYLAPEQTHGKTADRRTDIFALGVTLWEISVDRRLFKEDNDVETVRRVLAADVPDPTSLVADFPPALAAALLRALARDPEARYQDAAAFAHDLDACAGGATASDVVAVLRAVFPADRPRARWESALAEATRERKAVTPPKGGGRIEAWDDEAQKMTWMQVEGGTTTMGSAVRDGASIPGDAAALGADLAAHASKMAAAGDAGAAARAEIARALVSVAAGDEAEARRRVEAARALDPSMMAAHVLARRLAWSREAPAALLPHLDAEIAAANDASRASLLAERARLVDASGEPKDRVRAAWARALEVDAREAAALRGLDAALEGADVAGARAAHLARMAEAYAAEPRLAAWLHVERAALLDAVLGDAEGASGALDQALAAAPGLGAVRDACVDHAIRHRDAPRLVALLEEEAQLETDAARAARLELEAACIAELRLGDVARALALLDRAARRAPTTPSVDRRVQDDRVRLLGATEGAEAARAAARARLPLLDDARGRAHALRELALLGEKSGDVAAAVRDLEAARALDPEDRSLLDALDRLLAGDPVRRAQLWDAEAARADAGDARADALLRAAEIDAAAGQRTRAVERLRTALIARPGDRVVVDRLAALLASPLEGASAAEARARIALYEHAAERVKDPARKIAYLEKVAVLWEEVVGDAALAAGAYEAILALSPDHRGAVLALARAATKAGDRSRLARALLDEARMAARPEDADELEVRAAEALAPVDAERARTLLEKVIARGDGSADRNDEARAALIRLHEDAGRWGDVDAAMAARIAATKGNEARARLWAARAAVQEARLRAPGEALASLREAQALDPSHPGLVDAILTRTATLGDAAALVRELEMLATRAASPAERARLLARAGELEEHARSDDSAASKAYAAALEATPEDAWLEARLARTRSRLAMAGGRADAPRTAREALTQAPLRLAKGETGEDLTPHVEAALAADPSDPAALRTLEAIARRAGSVPLLANVLASQADAFASAAAKLGALWSETALVEWRLPASESTGVYERILEHAPSDRAALDALLRRAMPAATRGEAAARRLAVRALAALVDHATDDGTRAMLHLERALLLDGDPARARDALAAYREALRLDPTSLLAALGTARLAASVGDAEAQIAAAGARAELTSDRRARAHFLVQAAGALLGSQDSRLGAREVRRQKAGALLEAALEADPESLTAMGVLVTVRTEEGAPERLLPTLRSALARAEGEAAIVTIGGEVARIARADAANRPLAIDALERVRRAAPSHVATLLALSELYAAEQAWPEAIAALEAVTTRAQDGRPKRRAFAELAELYARVGRDEDVERALRASLDIDANDPRALRALAARLAARSADSGARAEHAALLERIAAVETTPQGKSGAWLEAADAFAREGDRAGTERALVEAAAYAPNPAAVARLASLHPPKGNGASEHARVLAAVAARAEQLGRPDASILAALGELEADVLGRNDAAVTHLRSALAIAPAMHEARAALARALVASGANDAAATTLLGMLSPSASPILSLRQPGAALVTLERALDALRRGDEALVARELRAVAGALDDAGHVTLRARRLVDTDLAPAPVLDGATLRARVLPREGDHVLLDVASAIRGFEPKVWPVDVAELGVTPRDRVLPASPHPLRAPFDRLMRLMAIDEAELVVTDAVTYPRVVLQSVPWVVVPGALAAHAEPLQIAALARPLARVALGVPWIDRIPLPHVRAVLTAAARTVSPSYATEANDGELESDVADYERRVTRALGRKQKKALESLAPVLDAARGATLAEVEAMVQAVTRVEVRVAFLASGDLLATFDELRAADADFARATGTTGPGALAAVLTHPLAGDVATFALGAEATTLRRAAGTAWTPRR